MIGSKDRDGFGWFVGGQMVIALASSILPQLAPQVSAVWFDVKEHAISTSIGIIIGNAGIFSFLLFITSRLRFRFLPDISGSLTTG